MGTSSDSLNSRRGCFFFSFSSFCFVNVPPSPLPLLLPLSLSPLVLFSLPSPPTWEADESDSGTAEVGQLICAHRPFPHKRSTAYLPVHVFSDSIDRQPLILCVYFDTEYSPFASRINSPGREPRNQRGSSNCWLRNTSA